MSTRNFASRLDKGSSNRKSFGSRTSARPMATRWRCPPDNWPGLRLRSGSICNSEATRAIAAFCSGLGTPRLSMPKVMFWRAVMVGYSAYDWNTMAMSRSFGATALTILPSIRISPSLALSSPAMIASSVDLPQPDGPTSAMNSPVCASRSMPLRTSTEPKRLVSRETVSVAMIAPSLDGALREPANEILAAEQIDQERRNGADQHGGACDVVG